MIVALSMVVVGFLLGSIPFGMLIGLIFFGVDLRKHGSGNIGAANAMRTIGKGGAAAVLLLDALKGAAAVGLAHFAVQLDPRLGLVQLMVAAGAAAVLGHCFTPWLGFHGGKGVATSLGVLLVLSWPAGLAGLVTYGVITKLSHVSAIGSLSAAVVGAIGLGLTLGGLGFAYGALSVALLAYTHRSNIARLRSGSELTLG